ncbi:FH2 domain-containing protein 1 [Clonorchis sinensis]|uniref:FH2 domain-containing protein 1 n=1 Tax=Clonorchis sinensis TaxID=79923 RepID=G7YA69_CLOSI|nr:FH2 domain-containing protein 1 [Clonorchis sinensis]
MLLDMQSPNTSLTTQGEALDVVERFTYLGSCISSDSSVTDEVDAQFSKARVSVTNLRHLWRQSGVSVNLKGHMYQATVRAALLYVCETWPVRAAELGRIQVFENRCLRSIARMTAKKPRLLDNKRCLNVNIYLRQFKSVSFSLIDAIDNRWSTLIGAERLRALVKLLPSEPEVGTFRSFSGDVETLDPAEKFLIELVTVSNYKQKIDHMLLREEFHSCSHWFGPALDKLLETVKALITSETLCGLLHLVLDLGNFLNEGKSFGAATAFKIESLLKLSDVRSINPKFTLLHFLVQHVQQHYPQYLSVRQEFPHIKESCGICTEAISKEIQKLQYRLKVMINQVGQEDDPPEDLLTFIETAKNEMDQLEARMVRLTELTNQCADYFSEERSSFRLTSCLQTFSTFFTKMDCAEQELRQMDLQQKKARQTEEGLCECDPTLEITIMQRIDLQAINDCLEVLPISVSFIMKIYKN